MIDSSENGRGVSQPDLDACPMGRVVSSSVYKYSLAAYSTERWQTGMFYTATSFINS